MSKRKTDETVTEAGTPKSPKKAIPRGAEPAEVAEAQPTEGKAPKEDLVVFAFRLKAEERDLIHKAAGAAKASRFIRTLAVAASRGDVKIVSEIVKSVQAELTPTS